MFVSVSVPVTNLFLLKFVTVPLTDTDTNISISYFRLQTETVGLLCFHLKSSVSVYANWLTRVSLFRVRDPRAFTNIYGHLRHLHIEEGQI
jgi:hypothetical protein